MLISPAQQIQLPSKQAVLSDLREKIGRLDGAARRLARTVRICDFIDDVLPTHGLPLGCIHEIKGSPASVIAFSGLLSARISQKGAILYISPDRNLYPLGLLPYGINLKQWIHVCARRPEDLVWTVLEALRCPQVNAVLAVLESADLTLCRRLQLAAESSGATGFLLGNAASATLASAITRWRITPIKAFPGQAFDEAAWNLQMTYCRGGRPDGWQVAWRNGELESLVAIPETAARSAQRQQLASGTAFVG